MRLQNQNVLFFAKAMGLGGSENVVLQLCEVFKPIVNRVVVCSGGGVNEEKLKKLGVRHYTIGDIENKTPNNILHVMKELKRIVSDEKITVIHTHHRMAAFYVEATGMYKYCCFINTSHNTFYNKRFFTRLSYKNANLIACGEMVKKNLLEYFGLEKVTTIRNAVKPFCDQIVVDEVFQKSKRNGGFIVVNIGRLSEQKGMEYFIRAIPEITKKHPETDFYIIGTGEDEEELKALSIEINAKVTFLGYRSDIQNLLSQVDLVVLSSLWEGLPLTPIEAFSVGKTIVATGVDGTCEIVKDMKNGLLISPRDVDGIANKVCWMIENPEEKKKMEISAKATFDNEFSFNVFAEAYKKYYEGL